MTEPRCKRQGTEAEHVAVTAFAAPEPPASSAPWCHLAPTHRHPGGWGWPSRACWGDAQLLLGPSQEWGLLAWPRSLLASAPWVCSAQDTGDAVALRSWD